MALGGLVDNPVTISPLPTAEKTTFTVRVQGKLVAPLSLRAAFPGFTFEDSDCGNRFAVEMEPENFKEFELQANGHGYKIYPAD